MSYYSVLSAAVEDLLDRGFVSSTQVSVWQARLKEAAEASFHLDSGPALERVLTGVYTRLIERGGLPRYHQGLPASTINRLQPVLRTELSKFLLSSEAFLKARREEAILASLRRFAGWASSIPPGGVVGVSRLVRKTEIKKPLASLPFEETRAIARQAENLTRAINAIVARDGDALAAQWHSRWRQPGYAYRKDHKEKDLKIFLFRDTWAVKAGLLRRGPWAEDQTPPGVEANCRCSYRFFYTLESLPREALSTKGLTALAVRA